MNKNYKIQLIYFGDMDKKIKIYNNQIGSKKQIKNQIKL